VEWVTSKCHMTAEHRLARAVQTLQADVHSSPASSPLNCPPFPRFKRTRPYGRKTKTGFCACTITFQTQSTHTNFTVHLAALMLHTPRVPSLNFHQKPSALKSNFVSVFFSPSRKVNDSTSLDHYRSLPHSL
jgi:hypothetical protein